MSSHRRILPARDLLSSALLAVVSLLLIFLNSCNKNKNENKRLPVVEIISISDITFKSVRITTRVNDEGGGRVSGTGICWSKSINPDLTNYVNNVGAGLGDFITAPNDLDSNTTYYVRAFATNEVGTAFSNNATFTTLH